MNKRNPFSREDELLLLLARGRLTPEVQGKAMACLQEELSWSVILQQAQAHDVFPLLYRNLLTPGCPGVPAEVRATLDRLYKTNAIRNLLLARELARLLQAFSAASIPVVPLKGVALAESLYGDPALRVCCHRSFMAGSSCIWSGQLAMSASDLVCSGANRRSTSASAAGLRCCCASSATTLWPSGPHACAGAMIRQASTVVATRRARLMQRLRLGKPAQSATDHGGFLPRGVTPDAANGPT